jgi:hypothetical protein
MGNRKRLNFTADGAQKERWEKFVRENPEYDSLLEFFRKASEHEMKRGHPLEERQNPQSSRVELELSDIRDLIKEVQSEVAWIRKQMHDESDLNDIAREVSSHLPTSVDEILRRQAESLNTENEFVNTGTLHDLAEVVDEDPRVIEDAITYLKNNFIEVKETTTDAGTTHYYRVD